MRIEIAGKTVTLSPKRMLGQGGEARVFRHGRWAVKIYHPLSGRERKRRFAKLRDFPTGLPDNVCVPEHLVFDTGGEPVGFAMAAVKDAHDLRHLSLRRWREGVISNAEVAAVFTRLHDTLIQLHDRGVVVGDLNDGNVLFAGTEPFLIDTDSMQFGSHACIVAHERFLDPALFGIDLTQERAFTPLTDWYAFSVLLFNSLLYVHPYGGVHTGYPTLLRRAEARHSILRSDVRRPKAATTFEILPDDLHRWFEAVFDGSTRDVFPARLLRASWTRCACGLEHARARCPQCSTAGRAARRPAIVTHGAVRAATLFRGERVLTARCPHKLVWTAVDADFIVRREDGTRVAELVSGGRYVPSGYRTFVGHGTSLHEVRSSRVIRRHTVETFRNETAFDANGRCAIAVQDDWLVNLDTGKRLGQVLGGQTFLRVGEKHGYGFYRVGDVTVHFAFDPERAGIRNVALPPIDGRLIDIDAVFSDRHILVSWLSERDGVETASAHLLRGDGTPVASLSGAPADAALLASTHGKALFAGRILCPTDDGFASFAADHDVLVAGRVFPETEPFVAAGLKLLPGPGGDVYVIHPREILEVTHVQPSSS